MCTSRWGADPAVHSALTVMQRRPICAIRRLLGTVFTLMLCVPPRTWSKSMRRSSGCGSACLILEVYFWTGSAKPDMHQDGRARRVFSSVSSRFHTSSVDPTVGFQKCQQGMFRPLGMDTELLLELPLKYGSVCTYTCFFSLFQSRC